MDPIFDKFGRLVKSWFTEDADLDFSFEDNSSDYKAAWDELEDFLKSDEFETDKSSSRQSETTTKTSSVPDYLREDFLTLEVSFGADISEVKKAYKKKILKYHPDRFTSDPEGQKAATRKASAINEAFQRIETYYEG